MQIVCLDLEGVLVPEIWIEFANRTGIEALRRTTRDEPDYDKLMTYRLDILRDNKLGLPDIQKVIAEMGPMAGAKDFLDQLRQDFQVIILSDTFYEFAMPLMQQLGMPALFCHKLEADAEKKSFDEAATKLLYLILNRSEKEWRMPPREWSMAKAQFAVLFGERFIKAMAA